MKLSLIVTTLGRDKELFNLFDSLEIQDYKNFEVIIVDQNKDNRVDRVVELYKDKIKIKHIKSKIKGISYNRNIGLNYISGDVLAFTDDDCVYNESLLSNVVNDLNGEKISFISYRIIDPVKKKYLARFPSDITNINRNNIFITMSASTFIKVNNLHRNDLLFDEKLGVGARFGSCEDVDLIFKLVSKGYNGVFIPKDLIYHPIKDYPSEVGFNYGLGLGAFIKKTIIVYNSKTLLFYFIKEIIKAFLGIFVKKQKRRYYWCTFKGRILGFINYKIL